MTRPSPLIAQPLPSLSLELRSRKPATVSASAYIGSKIATAHSFEYGLKVLEGALAISDGRPTRLASTRCGPGWRRSGHVRPAPRLCRTARSSRRSRAGWSGSSRPSLREARAARSARIRARTLMAVGRRGDRGRRASLSQRSMQC